MTPVTLVGDLAHPLYVFIQLFVLSQPLLNFAQFSSQENLCIFCFVTNLQLYELICAQKCVHMSTRTYIDLHSVQFIQLTSCTFCMPWVHFGCSVCIFVHIVHTCEFANIVLFFAHFVTNLQLCVSVQWQWILCTPNARNEVRVHFWGWRRIINEVSSSKHLVFDVDNHDEN